MKLIKVVALLLIVNSFLIGAIQNNQVVDDTARSNIGSVAREKLSNQTTLIDSKLSSPLQVSLSSNTITVYGSSRQLLDSNGSNGTTNSYKISSPIFGTSEIAVLDSTLDLTTGNTSGSFNANPDTGTSVSSNNYIQMGIELRSNGLLYVVWGTQAASSGATTAPSFSAGAIQIAKVLLRNNGTAGAWKFNTPIKSDITYYRNNSASEMWVRTATTGIIHPLNITDKVGIGTTTPSYKLQIQSAVQNPTTFPGQVALYDENTYSVAGAGGAIMFGGKYNAAGTITQFASIQGIKANTTDGNYGGSLIFRTRTHGNGSEITERMRIDGTGKVGIGTTSPSQKLHLFSTTSFNSSILLEDTTTSGNSATGVRVDNSGGNSLLLSSWTTSSTGTGYLGEPSVAGQNFLMSYRNLNLGTYGSGYLTLATNSSERMRITNNGKVGIGTDAPTNLLDVHGDMSIGDSTVAGTQSRNVIIGDSTAGSSSGLTLTGNQTSEANVGAISFHNQASTAGDKRLGIISVSRSADNASGYFRFYINNTGSLAEAMRISSLGYFGINNASPAEVLSVKGNANNPNGVVRIDPYNSNAFSRVIGFDSTGNYYTQLFQGSSGTASTFMGLNQASNSFVKLNPSTGAAIGTVNSTPLTIGTNNTAIMTFATSGAVGVNTNLGTTPFAAISTGVRNTSGYITRAVAMAGRSTASNGVKQLIAMSMGPSDVWSSTYWSSDDPYNDTIGQPAKIWHVLTRSDENYYNRPYFALVNQGVDKFVVDYYGRTGVGTKTFDTDAALQVKKTNANTYIVVEGGTGQEGIRFIDSNGATNSWYLYKDTTGDFAVYNNSVGSNLMRWATNGNVLIGPSMSLPETDLDIHGDIAWNMNNDTGSNYSTSGIATAGKSFIRMNGSTAVTIGCISDGTDGKFVTIAFNTGIAGNHTIVDNATCSSGYKIRTGTGYTSGSNIYLRDQAQISLQFDSTSNVWRIAGGSGSNSGGITNVTTVTSSSFTATAEHSLLLVNAASNNITINLPDASTMANKTYIIKRIDNSAYTITIDPNGSQTIDGNSTDSLVYQYEAKQLVSNGTNWYLY